MKKPPQSVALEVVPKTEILTVINKPSAVDYQSLLADTEADFAHLHQVTRKAAECALRIGMRVWCINQSKGGLKIFAALCKGKPGMSQPNIYRFMGMAEAFLEDAGYINKKRQLTDPDAVQPLMHEQIELWNSDREDAIGKAVAWINGRGMMEILRDMSQEAAPSSKFGGQLGNTSASVSPAQRRALDMAAAVKRSKDFCIWAQSDVFFSTDKAGNRKHPQDVGDKATQTFSLLEEEALQTLTVTCEQTLETIKHVRALRDGKTIITRKAKGKGAHS